MRDPKSRSTAPTKSAAPPPGDASTKRGTETPEEHDLGAAAESAARKMRRAIKTNEQ
jgi:hypothetical protein